MGLEFSHEQIVCHQKNCRVGDPTNEKDVSLCMDTWQLDITEGADAEQTAFGSFIFQGHGFVILV